MEDVVELLVRLTSGGAVRTVEVVMFDPALRGRGRARTGSAGSGTTCVWRRTVACVIYTPSQAILGMMASGCGSTT